jgi:hypothetical protein
LAFWVTTVAAIEMVAVVFAVWWAGLACDLQSGVAEAFAFADAF